MPRYCIVVRSANDALFQALEEAFAGKTEFSVVRERRLQPPGPWPDDRRKARVWETKGLVFAESDGD